MHRTRKAIARLLAVLAVIGAFIAIYVVVNGARSSNDGKGKNHPGKQSGKTGKGKGKGKGQKGSGGQTTGKAFYVVKSGDTLSGIAATTGVTVAELQTLNPSIDPQLLSTGEKIKLR